MRFRSTRPMLKRAAWLAGASLFVLGSTSALAANECGPPPPGGGTVTCPAGNYPGGIDYDTVEDLTVVLEPGVVTQQTVELSSVGAGVELSLQGPTNTSINSSQSGVGVGEGVLVVSTNGTVDVDVDDVRTTGADLSSGIVALGGSGVSVGVDTVGTIGTNSVGIFADSYDGSVTVDSGTVTTSGAGSVGIIGSAFGGDPYSGTTGVGISSDSVTTTGDGALGIVGLGGSVGIGSGTVVTSGDGAGGILAVGGTSKYVGGPPVGVSSDSVTTTGAQSFGIRAIAQEYGAVSINSGSVATSGDGSGGIEAESEFGSIRVTSDSVATEGADSTGILASVGLPPPFGFDNLGFARVDSGTVSTSGDRSRGIDVYAPNVIVDSDIVITEGADSDGIRAVSTAFLFGYSTDTTFVTSGSVTTTGDRSTGIHATSGTWDTRVVSTGTVSTAGDESVGIRAAADFGFAAVDSATVQTSGNGSTGIHASSGGGRVTISSGSVTTTGDASRGIEADVQGFVATIESGTVSTSGDDSDGIRGDGGQYGWVYIDSGSVVTGGDGSAGIEAESGYGNLSVISDSVVTTGDDSHGVAAATGPDVSPYFPTGLAEIDSGTIQTSGDRSRGINAYGAIVYIDSGTVTTQGVDSTGIHANSSGPLVPADGDEEIVRITSGSVTTNGDSSLGISAYARFWDIGLVSTGTVSTAGDDSTGISASSPLGWLDIDSATVVTSGDRSAGIVAIRGGIFGVASTPAKAPVIPGAAVGIRIVSGSVTTGGGDSPGILAENYDNYLRIFSTGTVTTAGDNSDGINGSNLHYSYALVDSHDVSTAGADSTGIEIRTLFGNLTVDSDNVATSGDRSLGIDARSQTGAITVTSGTVVTQGAGAAGIFAETTGPASPAVTTPADVSITSASVTTTGDDSPGIEAHSALGSVDIESGTVSTGGDRSGAIVAEAGADATVVSTGPVATTGDASDGIYAGGATVTVTSATVTTTGAGSTGILAVATAPEEETDPDAAASGGISILAVGPGGTSVTSGSVTTTGANSPGIEAHSALGDTEVISTGTVSTSGADSPGILADSATGFVTVDANAVTAAGAGSNAIDVDSATSTTVTIRGLVQSGQALALQADGGAATVAIVAGGTLRGRIDLTDNADSLTNGGTFDAIGTSQFGAGSDVFGNAAGATVRSVNGAAVLAGLETFNNSGTVEMRDGAVGDSLSVSGAFNGQAGSTLGLDVDFTAGTADRLIVGGSATGSTTINVQGSGSQFTLNPDGILVVDAGAGTQASAFTLAGAANSPYVGTSLRFDPTAFNFLIVSGPNQPVFETVKVGEIVSSLWYKSADAVDAQLQTSRDGGEESPGDALRGESGAGIWVQAMTGKTDREAVQSFTIGGTSASFDLSYEEEFQGLQGGVELGAGPLRFGVTGGFGEGDAVFDVTGNRVEFDVKNIGAYAELRSGGLWANALVKMDWIDLTTEPGAGLSAEFDARSFGAMVNLGYRAELGLFFVEPSAGIAWVKTDIDSYQSGGATVDFDDAESLRAQAGLRVGASFGVGESATLTPYVGVRAFDELRDGNTNRFTLGATLPLADDSPGTHGRAEAGFSLRAGNLEAFVRGELDFAGDTEGKSVRGGVRLRF